MKTTDDTTITNIARRELLLTGAAVATLAVFGLPFIARAQGASPIKIGIIGSGRIGGTLGELWVKAGNQVMFNDVNPDTVKALVDKLKPNARAGTAKEAIAFGDVVLLSVPYNAYPAIAQDVGANLKGKILLDTGNPNPMRDGEMGTKALAKGAGLSTAEFFPGARVVRAFNTVNFKSLQSETGRAGDKVAIPLASDNQQGLQIASRLVRDAGFEPLVVGGLAKGNDFDAGKAGYGKPHTAAELRQLLGM